MKDESVNGARPRGFAGTFLNAARKGTLLVQQCASCGQVNPYTVTLLCCRCGSPDLRERPAAGVGVVVSCTWVALPSDAGPARQVILAELDEGVQVLAIVEAPHEMSIGDRVRFVRLDALSGALVFGANVAAGRLSRDTTVGGESGASLVDD